MSQSQIWEDHFLSDHFADGTYRFPDTPEGVNWAWTPGALVPVGGPLVVAWCDPRAQLPPNFVLFETELNITFTDALRGFFVLGLVDSDGHMGDMQANGLSASVAVSGGAGMNLVLALHYHVAGEDDAPLCQWSIALETVGYDPGLTPLVLRLVLLADGTVVAAFGPPGAHLYLSADASTVGSIAFSYISPYAITTKLTHSQVAALASPDFAPGVVIRTGPENVTLWSYDIIACTGKPGKIAAGDHTTGLLPSSAVLGTS